MPSCVLNTFTFNRNVFGYIWRIYDIDPSFPLYSPTGCVVCTCPWLLICLKVPEFPVFTRSGEVTVAFNIVREVVLSADELQRLYSFHHFIFRHVLRLEKLPMTFDPDHAESSNIVLPVNKGSNTSLSYCK